MVVKQIAMVVIVVLKPKVHEATLSVVFAMDAPEGVEHSG